MSLRDAIDAGWDEIRINAEEVIASLNIEERLKQAVVLGQTRLSISFNRSENMIVIQQEVVRQITEEGFVVQWDKPCCPDALMDRKWTDDTGLAGWKCSMCDSWREVPHAMNNQYGQITIEWD